MWAVTRNATSAPTDLIDLITGAGDAVSDRVLLPELDQIRVGRQCSPNPHRPSSTCRHPPAEHLRTAPGAQHGQYALVAGGAQKSSGRGIPVVDSSDFMTEREAAIPICRSAMPVTLGELVATSDGDVLPAPAPGRGTAQLD